MVGTLTVPFHLKGPFCALISLCEVSSFRDDSSCPWSSRVAGALCALARLATLSYEPLTVRVKLPISPEL